jgi:hypothetical protein
MHGNGTWCVVPILAMTLLGCGSDELDRFKEGLVPVSGTVTLDGEPVEGAAVFFIPASFAKGTGGEVGARPAWGNTDATGRYSLASPPKGPQIIPEDYAGCLPGEYVVGIEQRPDGPGDSGAANPAAQAPNPAARSPMDSLGSGPRVPGKYHDAMTSGLTATITTSGGEINFELERD